MCQIGPSGVPCHHEGGQAEGVMTLEELDGNVGWDCVSDYKDSEAVSKTFEEVSE